MLLEYIPEDIVTQYNLRNFSVDGWVYMEIRKLIPGLKKAGKIAHDQLKNHLDQFNYLSCERAPSLWRYNTRPNIFTLVLDEFRIKYSAKQHAQHLISVLQKNTSSQ